MRPIVLVGLLVANPVLAAPVVISGGPVAPAPSSAGQGLCMASQVSTNPGVDFPQSSPAFNSGINALVDQGAPVLQVLATPLDLSNNLASDPQQRGRGDFVDASAGCPSFGCGFAVNDSTTSFATRLRAYLNVTEVMVGRPLHFGFYADDAVSLTFFDAQRQAYAVITRPPQLGVPAWRTTNSVTFMTAGLYPVEILHAQISEHAVLELAVLDGEFTDVEAPANSPGVTLSAAGFALVTPSWFYLDVHGTAPTTGCTQCPRAAADSPGTGGCAAETFCNAAAVCAPCNTNSHCGASCDACADPSPVCADLGGTFSCVECTGDEDCPAGNVCDPAAHACVGCVDDQDCAEGVCDPTGQTCVGCIDDTDCPSETHCTQAGLCVECETDAQCAAEEVCELNVCVPCSTCLDAGPVLPDAAVEPDASGPVDAAEPMDATVPMDASVAMDAGSPPDAATTQRGEPVGCGCIASVMDGAPWMAALALLGLWPRRRR